MTDKRKSIKKRATNRIYADLKPEEDEAFGIADSTSTFSATCKD